jgi:hypothetical protein
MAIKCHVGWHVPLTRENKMEKKNAQFKNNLFHYQWFFEENILHEKTTFNDQSVLTNVITFPIFCGYLILIKF